MFHRGVPFVAAIAGRGASASASQQILTLADEIQTDTGVTIGVYDPTNPDTRTLDGSGNVSAVSDGMGNYPDFEQATEASRPQLAVGEFGQLDALFAPGDEHLTWPAAADDLGAQPNVYIALVKASTLDADNQIFFGTNAVATQHELFITTADKWRVFAGSNHEVDADTAAHTLDILWNGASSDVRWDDLPSFLSIDVGAEAAGRLEWLAMRNAGFLNTNGYGGPWIIANGDIGAAARQKLRNLLHTLGSVTKANMPGAWTWFNDPRALHYSGKYVAGAIHGNGGPSGTSGLLVTVGIDGDGDRTYGNIAAVQLDDHANAAFVRRASDNRFMAFYAKHNDADYFMAVSIDPDDASAFGTPTNIDSQLGHSNYTYANAIQIASGRIYLFFRATNASTGDFAWHYSYSDDDGTNWITGVQISGDGRPYHKFRKNGDSRIDIIVNDGHPNAVATNGTYHFYLLDTEGTITFHQSDGTEITSPPFDNTDWTQIYDATTDPRSWIHDVVIDGSGNPVVCFATFPTDDDHRYHQARWNGVAWSHNEITDAGGPLYATEPEYSGGVVTHPDDVDTVYCSRQVDANGDIDDVDGIFQIFKFTTTDNGATWTGEQLTTNADYSFRPYVPEGGSNLFYVKGTYTSFQNFDTTIEPMDI